MVLNEILCDAASTKNEQHQHQEEVAHFLEFLSNALKYWTNNTQHIFPPFKWFSSSTTCFKRELSS